ncbi:MAG: nitrophenyl compound nitroreductase subunit ArsF family protein [Proteobacteria bacterium]|nr:nitrophenyl compound nitroreductase subunit ArsF family protein [Pseudomonadota bacterium]
MKIKTVVMVVLLAFVAGSLGWLILKPGPDKTTEAATNPSSTEATTPTEATAPSVPKAKPTGSGNPSVSPRTDRVIVYYFHNTFRCPTCHKIEQYTKEAMESGFSQELRDGRVDFQVLNIDEPTNSHFIQDYKLYTKSVVVVDIKDGKQVRWNNLAKVWELVGNQKLFIKYIQDEVNLYLKGK